VSTGLRRYIKEAVGREDAIVIPSCLDQKKIFFDIQARKNIREQYGYSDASKVICYSGGLAIWQRVADIISLFESLARYDSNYQFLFLTKEAKTLQEWLRKSELARNRYVVESCTQETIYRYLSAADAGIIMRKDTVVNNVASPIKVGEYLGCGLPLILTKGIGDYSDLLPKAGIGLLLDESGNTARQVDVFMRQLDREKVQNSCIKFSHEYFAIESYRLKYDMLYA
jgi:glycosyltransferase involved in cell wall biosynthesis